MPEASYLTIDHSQVNVFLLPIKATTGWTSLATPDLQFAQAQVDRLQSLGLGAFDLALRKRYEVGRLSAMEQVASSAVDKPATLEWLSYGSTTANRRMRIWNCLAGRDYTAVTDITQADFDATTSECCLIVHKLDEAKANVIESYVIWRCVVDTIGISVPNSQDDDVRISVRLTGDEFVMASNAAGKAIGFLETAVASEVSIPASYRDIVERDDWADDDDGTNERTLTISDPAVGAASLDVRDETGFSEGHYIKVKTTDDLWETTTVSSASANTIVPSDLMDLNHIVGSEVSRTRGYFLFVYNQTSGAYLEAGTDYRVKKTTSSDLKIINVDGGSAIGTTDEVWAVWLIPSGAEMWTDNDADLYGVTHPMTRFMVSPEATFVTTTVGFDGTAVTEDTDFQFDSSGGSADQEWSGYRFTAAATGKIDSVQLLMNRAGSPAGEVFAEIWTDDGGGPPTLPSAQSGNPSVPLNNTDDLTTAGAGAMETFRFTDGPEITSATDYWVVLKTQGYTLDGATTNVTWLFEDAGQTGGAANQIIVKGDPDGVWVKMDETSSAAEVNVNLIGSQWVERIQGMDMSVTFSRSANNEMGSATTLERTFDETDVRITTPKFASDNTTWSRVVQKNTASVKTVRPEQNPQVWCRFEEYSTIDKNAGDVQLVYEFPQLRRSGGEQTAPANERMTERITLAGDQFTIAAAL